MRIRFLTPSCGKTRVTDSCPCILKKDHGGGCIIEHREELCHFWELVRDLPSPNSSIFRQQRTRKLIEVP